MYTCNSNVSVKLLSTASDPKDKRFQNHAALAHSTLLIINILLTKLSSNSKNPQYSSQQDENCQTTFSESTEESSDGTSCLKEKDDGIRESASRNSQKCKTPDCVDDKEGRGHFSIKPLRDGNFVEELFKVGPEEESVNNEHDAVLGSYSGRLLKGVLKSVLGPSVVLCAAHANGHSWTNSSSLRASHGNITIT